MFGATSKADLGNPEKEKRTFFNRDLPDQYSQGGLNIGNENSGNSRKQSAKTYKAQLDIDIANNNNNKGTELAGLPDAKKRSAYDFVRKELDADDHPLGRSSMRSLGAPSNFKPPRQDMAELAAQKRNELNSNRFDIITSLAKATDPANTPRQRMQQELLVGIPINGKDDGILEIGASASEQQRTKKEKQRTYFAQLSADQAGSGSAPNSARGSAPDSARRGMTRDQSSTRVELTGSTGYQIGRGLSRDMNASMKDVAFDAKRQAQAAYRAALANQQADNAYHKSVASARDAQFSNDDLPPYMQ